MATLNCVFVLKALKNKMPLGRHLRYTVKVSIEDTLPKALYTYKRTTLLQVCKVCMFFIANRARMIVSCG